MSGVLSWYFRPRRAKHGCLFLSIPLTRLCGYRRRFEKCRWGRRADGEVSLGPRRHPNYKSYEGFFNCPPHPDGLGLVIPQPPKICIDPSDGFLGRVMGPIRGFAYLLVCSSCGALSSKLVCGCTRPGLARQTRPGGCGHLGGRLMWTTCCWVRRLRNLCRWLAYVRHSLHHDSARADGGGTRHGPVFVIEVRDR